MEHISTTTLIITLIVMVIISAYFSGSETGMMTLNRYRLRHMAKQGNRPAKRVEKLLRKPDRLISLVLIGNNLVNILASALGTIVGMRLYGDAVLWERLAEHGRENVAAHFSADAARATVRELFLDPAALR